MNKKKKKHIVKKSSFHWKKWARTSAIILGIISVITVTVLASGHQTKIEHDLSVIGNGTPTVVQIHDPNCQLCQRLKNNLNSVKGDFKDQIQFKTANIKTAKGKQFAEKHNVPHVTLLLFDKRGRHTNTLRGVSPKQAIRTALQTLKP